MNRTDTDSMPMLPPRRLRVRGRRGPWRRTASRRQRRGFTLPELMVVMTIVGVVSLLVVPSIQVVPYRMDGSARGAMAALVSAQRLAVKRQHDVVVAFDTAHTGLLIHEDGNNNGVRDEGERVRPVMLGDGVHFGLGGAPARPGRAAAVSFDEALDGRPAFRFMRNGSASQEGSFYLTSGRAVARGDYAEDARSVQVERATGRVSWYHFEDGQWKPGF